MKRKRLYWQVPLLLLLIGGTLWIGRQQRTTPYQTDQGAVFGTYYSIVYQCADNLQQDIEAELGKVDMALSMFNDASAISRINRNEAVNLKDEPMFLEVYRQAIAISEETGGAFDITVAPLVNAWGFGFKHGTEPTQTAIDSLRQLVGYRQLTLHTDRNQTTLEKTHDGTMLDCSAIAKGYGCDVVARLLKRKGVENYMVEIGGEVVAKGHNAKRSPWRIGINKPTEDSTQTNRELQTVLAVSDKAMATSGNYRNFYYKDGKKYAHTIDPRTGYPVQHSLLSATVLAPSCATADAYATAFMVIGKEQAQALLDKHRELMAYLIYTDPDGQLHTWYSPKMKRLIADP